MKNTFKIPRKYTSAQANIYFNPVTNNAFISNNDYILRRCTESTMQRLHDLTYSRNIRISFFRNKGENWIIFQRRDIPQPSLDLLTAALKD